MLLNKRALTKFLTIGKYHVELQRFPAVIIDIPESVTSALKFTPPSRPRPAVVEVDEEKNVEEQSMKESFTIVTEVFLH